MLLLSCDIWPHLLLLAALLHIMVTIAGALTQQVLVAQPCVVHELCEHRFHWPSLLHIRVMISPIARWDAYDRGWDAYDRGREIVAGPTI